MRTVISALMNDGLQKNSRYACSWEREGALIRVALIVVQSMSVNFKGIMS